MIREITTTLDTFIGSFTGYLDLQVPAHPESTNEKIQKVAVLVFISIAYVYLHAVAPNICVLGIFVGIVCGRKLEVQHNIRTIINVWREQSLIQNIIIVAGAFFALPLVVAIGSFIAYAAAGDHICRASAKITYDLGWRV